jgi:hypothetical protein
MQTMPPAEWREFLLAGPRTAKLATVRPDGGPHVAPVLVRVPLAKVIARKGLAS